MSVNGLNDHKVFVQQHKNQLEESGVPEHLWATLHNKLKHGTFDAGSSFSFCQVAEDGEEKMTVVVIDESGIKVEDPQQIYLVDHRWTFRPQMARQQLQSHPNLVDMVIQLLGVEQKAEGLSYEEKIELVLVEKWRLAQTYSVSSAGSTEERMPVWYLIDEFAAKIRHSDDPNFRLVPFIHLVEGVAYSLLFPIRDCEHMEEVTRDVLESPEGRDADTRRALRNIFEQVDLTEVNWHQSEPDAKYFTTGKQEESLPDLTVKPVPLPKDRKIRVFSEYSKINENLKHPRFEIVTDPSKADVLWLMSSFKDYKGISETEDPFYINQFPSENVLTVKDFLCIVARRMATTQDSSSIEALPKWLPITFSLQTELPKFVSYYQRREKAGLDNHWIVKPWNLARALDTQVAKELPHILRQIFSTPKIVQKYLHDPVLFERPEIGRVKFDVRYVLLLKSVKPLKLYAYDRFWLRFANQPFELNKLDVYEKHFTVMNYNEADLKQMFCHDFIKEFEAQYPDFSWKKVEQDIFKMFKGALLGASAKEPPCGIGHCPQSGALYAVDLMLNWEKDNNGERYMQPKLLEFNFGADCNRACDYYPEFFDNVFSTLFLDEPTGQHVTLL